MKKIFIFLNPTRLLSIAGKISRGRSLAGEILSPRITLLLSTTLLNSHTFQKSLSHSIFPSNLEPISCQDSVSIAITSGG